MEQIQELHFEDITVGQTASFEFEVTEEAVRKFAELSGDHNPLHTDEAYAKTTDYKQPIAHGMLVGSLFSRLVGMHLPGKCALYLSQSLEFKQPVVFGSKILVEGVVEQKVDALRILKIQTSAYMLPSRELCVSGMAMVKVLK